MSLTGLLDYQEKIFNIFIFLTYLFYISMFFGISFIKPDVFWHIDYYIKLYVAIFLIVRYNPFVRTRKFTPLDRKLSFHAGVFIFTTLALKSLMVYFTGKDPTWVSNTGLCGDDDKTQSTTD
jgi:hypothetical protein